MRLLSRLPDNTLDLTYFDEDDLPPYAILSHTWSNGGEITYQELVRGADREKIGYAKIGFCVDQAAADGLHYSWVDTCCIDRSTSDELSTAINSMFRYYQRATKCYVYLSDVQVPDEITDVQAPDARPQWITAFQRSRWFTRGWTLQELLAPPIVEFFSTDGKWLGNRVTLEQEIHEITQIPVSALRRQNLTDFSIDERMSWAARRTTKLKEDRVYSLLGIFKVFLPLIYGEGYEYAAARLREEIRRRQEAQDKENLRESQIDPINFMWDFDDYDDLWFVKTRNCQSGWIEVHATGYDRQYKQKCLSLATKLALADADNGSFFIENQDLYFVKTKHAGSNKVELHILSRASGYKNFTLHTPTIYDLADVEDGHFLIRDKFLYFIKVKNCHSGNVEVYTSDIKDGYARGQRFKYITNFSPEADANGTWSIYRTSSRPSYTFLMFIKTQVTDSGHVEVRRELVDFGRGELTGSVYNSRTWFGNERGDGIFGIGRNCCLNYVKTHNTPRTIEVHVADYGFGNVRNRGDNYTKVHHFTTCFGAEDADNGHFFMVPSKYRTIPPLPS